MEKENGFNKSTHRNQLIDTYSISTGIKTQCFTYNTQSHEVTLSYPTKKAKAWKELRSSFIDILKDHLPTADAPSYFRVNLESYFAVVYCQEDHDLQIIVGGPVLFEDISARDITTFIKSHAPKEEQEDWLDYYFNLQRISLQRYNHLVSLLFRLTKDHFQHLPQVDSHDIQDNIGDLDKKFMEYRDIDFYHIPYALEQRLMETIRDGNIEAFLEIQSETSKYHYSSLCQDDPLRSMKNRAIVICVLLQRQAVEGGLSHHLSYTLGDCYIWKIEKQQSILSVGKVIQNMCQDYIKRVKNCKTKNYDQLISNTLVYIDRNIHRPDLSVKEISVHLKVHPNYLSTKFNKDVGLTITAYIHQQRLNSATRLLKYTDNSLLDIALHIGYSTQSYFCKKFKDNYGMTPLQYKNREHIR